jgi:PhnB protein
MAVRGSEVLIGQAIPHLVVHDAVGAVEFYKNAFGAREVYRSAQPTGRGLHIHLRIGQSLVIVSDDDQSRDQHRLEAHYRISSPKSLGGTTTVIQFFWPDVDSAYKRAIDAGAQPTVPPFDAFWGDRYGCVSDPYGHVWAMATQKEALAPAEVQRRMHALTAVGVPADNSGDTNQM